jgi:hypothetical protein
MAAKQRETSHEVEDGFVVAWDSSELNEDLSKKLAAIVNDLNEIVKEEINDVSEKTAA